MVVPLLASFTTETTQYKPRMQIIAKILSLSGKLDFQTSTEPKIRTIDRPKRNINGKVNAIIFRDIILIQLNYLKI